MDYVDVQVSIDGADAATNDAVRGDGSFAAAAPPWTIWLRRVSGQFKISAVMTRENVTQLDRLAEIAQGYGAQLSG